MEALKTAVAMLVLCFVVVPAMELWELFGYEADRVREWVRHARLRWLRVRFQRRLRKRARARQRRMR